MSGYNRALAMHRPDKDRSPVQGMSALQALAANELQLVYLFVRWSNCTDVGYTMHGLGKKGDAFRGPSLKQVIDARKVML